LSTTFVGGLSGAPRAWVGGVHKEQNQKKVRTLGSRPRRKGRAERGKKGVGGGGSLIGVWATGGGKV